MNENPWLGKKPESIFDWLGILFLCIVFYMLLDNLGFFWGGFNILLGYLSPFAGGVVLAYVLDPLVRTFQKKLFRQNPKTRGVSILLAYVAAVLGLALLVWMVVPQVGSSFNMLYNSIPGYIGAVTATLQTLQNDYGLDLSFIFNFLQDYQNLITRAYQMVTSMAPGVMDYLGNVASNVIAVFTAVASSLYMLADKDHLLRQLHQLTYAFLPRRVAANVVRICGQANANFSGFFIGKIIDSCIIGALTFVSMLVLRLDFAPLISVVVGITNIIPVFGPFIGAVPGVLILLFADPIQAVIFLVLILIIQQLDGNFIGPKILGESIGISALWVLFAIVLGGDLWGLVGMVLGVPVFATLYGLIKEFTEWNLARRGLNAHGEPVPCPGQEEPETPPEGPAAPSARL